MIYVNSKIRAGLEINEATREYIMMTNQVVVKDFAKLGDVGALGIISGTKKAFGMLNGGGKTVTIYSHIANVLDNLGVELLM